jgi:hypothetical protein
MASPAPERPAPFSPPRQLTRKSDSTADIITLGAIGMMAYLLLDQSSSSGSSLLRCLLSTRSEVKVEAKAEQEKQTPPEGFVDACRRELALCRSDADIDRWLSRKQGELRLGLHPTPKSGPNFVDVVVIAGCAVAAVLMLLMVFGLI